MAITVYTYNDKVLKNTATDKWLKKIDEWVCPPQTMRIQFISDYDITNVNCVAGPGPETRTLVDATNNIWDITNTGTWYGGSWNVSKIKGIIGINFTDTGVGSGGGNIRDFFGGNTSGGGIINLLYVKDNCINFGNATDASKMFYGASSLTKVPKMDTSTLTNVNQMFQGCVSVESGALELYQQMASQVNPPSSHSYAFDLCGSNTTTGAAELAQIPSSWGGTAS